MHPTITATAGVLAVLLASAAQAAAPAIYKCTSTNGHITYTQTPPDNGGNCTALGSTHAEAPPPTPPKRATPKPKKATPAVKVNAGDATIRRNNCTRAHHNLKILTSGKPVVETQSNGKQTTLDKAQRAKALKQTRKDIKYWCH